MDKVIPIPPPKKTQTLFAGGIIIITMSTLFEKVTIPYIKLRDTISIE